MSRPRSDVLRAQLLSGNGDVREQALAAILTAYFKAVMQILRRQYWSLRLQDWEEIWSWAVWDLDRMVTDGKLAPDGDLQLLLLHLARNRAAAHLKSQIRYHLRLTRLFANAVDGCDKKDGMFRMALELF